MSILITTELCDLDICLYITIDKCTFSLWVEVGQTTKFLCYNNVHPKWTTSAKNESFLTAQV